jgi:hypothetical protein
MQTLTVIHIIAGSIAHVLPVRVSVIAGLMASIASCDICGE